MAIKRIGDPAARTYLGAAGQDPKRQAMGCPASGTSRPACGRTIRAWPLGKNLLIINEGSLKLAPPGVSVKQLGKP